MRDQAGRQGQVRGRKQDGGEEEGTLSTLCAATLTTTQHTGTTRPPIAGPRLLLHMLRYCTPTSCFACQHQYEL